MISVLADENIPRASIELLRDSGVDVFAIAESSPGVSDAAVLELARVEGRVLVTFDRDFGEMIYRHGHSAPLGVVQLRFIPSSPEEPAVILRNLLEQEAIELEGRFTTVMRDQVRQRPLP